MDEERDAKYGKHQGQVSRQRLGLFAFFVGLAVGFIAAERFYLYQNMSEGRLPPWYAQEDEASSAAQSVEQKQQQQSGLVQLTTRPLATRAPVQQAGPRASATHSSQELQSLLETIAPTNEVMIAISDYNLVREGMLTTWIKVRSCVDFYALLLMSPRPRLRMRCADGGIRAVRPASRGQELPGSGPRRGHLQALEETGSPRLLQE